MCDRLRLRYDRPRGRFAQHHRCRHYNNDVNYTTGFIGLPEPANFTETELQARRYNSDNNKKVKFIIYYYGIRSNDSTHKIRNNIIGEK